MLAGAEEAELAAARRLVRAESPEDAEDLESLIELGRPERS